MENQEINIETLRMDKAQFLDRIFEITTADNLAGVGEVVSGVLDEAVRKTGKKEGKHLGHKLYTQYVRQYLDLLAVWTKSLDANDYGLLLNMAMYRMRMAEERDGGAVCTVVEPPQGLTRMPDVTSETRYATIHIVPHAFVHQSMEIGVASMLAHLIPIMVDRMERHLPDIQPYAGDTLNVLGLEILHAYGAWLAGHLERDPEHLVRWMIGKAGEVAFMKGVRTEANILLPNGK